MSFTAIIDREAAGALIPAEQATQIISAAAQESVAMALGRVVRMSSKVQKQPVLSALPKAYWVQGDSGLKIPTEAAWEGVDLVAEELACLVPIPQAVFDDSGFPIWTELRPAIAGAFAGKLDAAAFMGVEKPASWPAAMLQAATAAGNTAPTGMPPDKGGVFGDLEQLLSLVEDDGFLADNFAAAPRVRRLMRQARTTIGDPLGASTNTAWDLPVAVTPAITAPTLAFAGDFKMLVIAVRQDISYTIATEGVISDDAGKVVLNLLQQDSIALRVVFRVGYAVANPATPENPDPATRYPFAVLSDAASGELEADAEPDVDVAEGERQPRPSGRR